MTYVVGCDFGCDGGSCFIICGEKTSILDIEADVISGVLAGASCEFALYALVSDSEVVKLTCVPVCMTSGPSESSKRSSTISSTKS